MNTYISLLRGINVSGQKKIKMTELVQLYERAGFRNTQTYIQSGNVVFQSNNSIIEAERIIQNNIEKYFGYIVPVIVISKEELVHLIAENPFLESGSNDIRLLHLTHLAKKPENNKVLEITNFRDNENQFKIEGKNIYLYCPNGYGKVKINNTFFEKKLGIQATTRNWKTILTLADMANHI
jgi:uncharacterized protein (DUF1697 family)